MTNPLALTSAILALAPELRDLVSDIVGAIKGAPNAPAAARRIVILAGRRAILRNR